ncbi:MAG TPA: hypothetical protein VFB42_12925 [Gaiellaceae bacterium]|nr:hypothetical protein [Gaiellaceae bacterium]
MGSRGKEESEIAPEPLRPPTFGRTSPVTAHWLTRCDGFRVVGVRGRASVERPLFDDDPLRPVALRVRRSVGRSVLVPTDDVEAMCPRDRVIYVRRPATAAARAAAAAALAAAAGAWVGRAAVLAGLRLAALWRIAAPVAAAAVRAAAAGARRRWPAVRHGLAAAARASAAALLGLSIVGARILRSGATGASRCARRLVPHGARLAGESVALARRAIR